MGRWKYTLKEGKWLRELIHSEGDSETIQCDILEQLKLCYKTLLKQTSIFDEYDLADIEENLYLLDGDDILIHLYYSGDPEWEEYGYDTPEELIDDRLEGFYNLCDVLRVWIDV